MNGWVKLSERKPTKADADIQGCVLLWHEMNGVLLMDYRFCESSKFITDWQRVPQPPEGMHQATEEELLEKCGWTRCGYKS